MLQVVSMVSMSAFLFKTGINVNTAFKVETVCLEDTNLCGFRSKLEKLKSR